MEFIPFEENVAKGKLRGRRTPKEWFDFYSQMYIKYIETYKKLEDVYDQILHPQKRVALFEILKNTLSRVLEIKKDLIMFNVHSEAKNSIFINLDELFFDLKISPEKLEVPIPRFVKEINYKALDVRDQLIKKYFIEDTGQDKDNVLPEEEELIYRDFEKIDDTTAMHWILVNERGRQGILRATSVRDEIKGNRPKRRQGNNPNEKNDSSTTIQKYFRAYLDRKKIHQMRLEEMEFLGMLPEEEAILDTLNEKVDKIRHKRKIEQKRNMDNLIDATNEIKANLMKTESPDIKEKMLYDRRNWITDFYEDHEGKELPQKVEDFYERHNVGKPLSPEELELKKKEAAAKKKAKQKAKANKKKKKKTEKEEFLSSRVAKGAENSLLLKMIKTGVDNFSSEWASKEEADNFEQTFDRQLIVGKVMPEIEKNIEKEVDEIIKCELKNLYTKLSIKKKKGKKKKKKKKKKGKKKKIPGAKLVGNYHPTDLMGNLSKAGVLKMLKQDTMADFKGGYNLLRTIQEAKAEKKNPQPDPSFAQLRNSIKEIVGIPLGAGFTEPGKMRTYLFYGPQGTGKSLMVRALATECRAMVLDISPYVVESMMTDKKEITKLMYTTFKVAKEFQPAIILIDEAEHYWPSKKAKKKTKKGQLAGKCVKMKKDLVKQIKKHLDPEDRVAVIACTNRPYYMNTKEVKKLFAEKFYFPYPDYQSRGMLFKDIVKKKGIQLTEDFPLSQFCLMTEGYTGSSVRA